MNHNRTAVAVLKTGLGLVGTVSLLATAVACSDSNADDNADGGTPAIQHREADGDLTANGGARRLDGDQGDYVRDAVAATGAKNVILLIGDGMGDSEITAARNFAEGASGSFKGIDALPVTGQYTHYSLNEDGTPNYVTDSAASGTAWATGTKSYNGAIGVDVEGESQQNLIEKAKSAGLATGNVSTAEIQDATPAVQAAHVAKRKCYGPEDTDACGDDLLDKGGDGSISEQYLESRADVTLGGGAESFAQKAKAGDWKGKTLLEQAEDRGYQLPTNAAELDAVSEANQDSPVLGLFSDGNMPVRWDGDTAEKEGYLKPAQECTDNPERTEDIPKLASMTNKAIDLLSNNDDGKENGFFLQVEGASIDKEDHAANPCGQIGETVDLDEAVQEALSFAEEDGETLVLVTADHAHTSQIVGGVDEDDIKEIAEDKGISVEEARATVYPGLSRNLITREGAEMTIAYATSDNVDTEAQGHTGTQLRIAAYGPSAANVSGLTDQTDLHFTIADALGL
ncbi:MULTISPECIES: alkaline phosphatase [unclassified Corynebacterium]|uniref:alkaline phosphatase n=1 Tax=unclassified Corynebacterium TaxID=2624378 RepID=UPI002647F410|nr:alkaline phosphatase [Corynebacterium sp.]MDN5582429.1 alkaline phosphatase [Corynebacterium sp.]MDN5719974.1 alkaline phosphatase [Corynebacterium sp.]MDN6324983.1 alkaline phosphatase [Corynebacterium sp.]